MLSKLNTMVKTVDENLDHYRIPEAARALQDFVDEMSNWYVRRGRERYWVQGLPADKIAAYMTLYTALVTTAKAAAPMIPFMTENIYQNLVRSVDIAAPESIHLCDFPTVDEGAIDEALENSMEEVLSIVVLGRAARNGAALKNRQPLAAMYVKADGKLDDFYTDIIKEELNIKQVIFTEEAEDFVSYSFKPQLKTVGPKFGKQLNEIRTALTEIDSAAAKAELDANGSLTLSLPSGTVVLETEDLLIDTKQREGFYTVADRGVTVAIDTVLTEELIEDGFVRELISKIQTMRKEAGFHVTDHITVTMAGSASVLAIAENRKAEIAGDTLADALLMQDPAGYTKEWDINGETVTIGVQKI